MLFNYKPGGFLRSPCHTLNNGQIVKILGKRQINKMNAETNNIIFFKSKFNLICEVLPATDSREIQLWDTLLPWGVRVRQWVPLLGWWCFHFFWKFCPLDFEELGFEMGWKWWTTLGRILFHFCKTCKNNKLK